jgi:hypothetical protein
MNAGDALLFFRVLETNARAASEELARHLVELMQAQSGNRLLIQANGHAQLPGEQDHQRKMGEHMTQIMMAVGALQGMTRPA